MDRPAPALHLICPPVAAGTSCIIREAGERQEWRRVTLDDDELDYYNLDKLWPGWQVWAHEGRFISDNTLRHLNWLMCPRGAQPESAYDYSASSAGDGIKEADKACLLAL